jgi:hypothetical protein
MSSRVAMYIYVENFGGFVFFKKFSRKVSNLMEELLICTVLALIEDM